MKNIYLGLIHYPVKRHGETIASSITNMDIHDISRIAVTYGLSKYYIIHPDPKQQNIAQTLADHWIKGEGKKQNPDRYNALKILKILDNLDRVKEDIFKETGETPLVLGTSAIANPKNISLNKVKKIKKNSLLILFGTAGGISEQLFDNIDYFVEPIDLGTGYNHLSVRSAVSIFVDRLLFHQ